MVERHAFGVCQHLGERMEIPPSEVRKYFIYTSFIALGSPVIIYLILTFVLNLRYMIKTKRNPVWDI